MGTNAARPRNTRRLPTTADWAWGIGLILLAWGLRLCCLESVPPGWRDDELINIHTLSGEVLAGRFPLYFTGASGHEPLYHYLHAGLHAVLGFNVLSGHLLSAALGTLTVALTFTLARRLFGRAVAGVASAALASSFWGLMYSRIALRHVSLPPLALAILCLLPMRRPGPANKGEDRRPARWAPIGFLLGASLYTYPAARLLPPLVVIFAAYMALLRRDWFRLHRRGLLLALALTAVLAVPLGVAIARGRSAAATEGIGADARIAELAIPLRELRAGNPHPLLESAWTTLGMFHATGDPEWLYNVAGRPVFNLLGGMLLWGGVALSLWRWRQPRYFLLLLWMALGLLPAFVSVPPASLSHTILAQPGAYVLLAVATVSIGRRVGGWMADRLGAGRPVAVLTLTTLILTTLATNAARDLRDYFIRWPQQGLVRFLYRADYREAARWLDTHPELVDVAISSALMGPWDRLALAVDGQRGDVGVRLFNPERALIWPGADAPSTLLLVSWPEPAPSIGRFLEAAPGPPEEVSPHLTLHRLPPRGDLQLATGDSRFANGLTLTAARWADEAALSPGQEAVLLTAWLVAAPLDLPPIPIVANPPPPGVYAGPRLAVFTHLVAADGTLVAGDDGLWVDPVTLQPGDRLAQLHRLALPADAPTGPYTLELGLYDPKTGERWAVLDSTGQRLADRVLVPGPE